MRRIERLERDKAKLIEERVDFIPGVKGMWHRLSHWKQIEAGGDNFDGTSWTTRDIKYEQYLKVIRFHHEQVAYFLGRLRDIP